MDNELKKHVLKTGTTTVGIVCKDGVILAADRRGTYGGDSGVHYIAGKDEDKIFKVTDNIIVTIAGVFSDIQKVIKLVRAELKLKELKSKSKTTIKEAANLFANITYQNIRQFSVIPGITHFLLSGYDDSGFYLYDIHPDGGLREVKDHSTSGSGMISTNPILDSDYRQDIDLEKGVELAKKAINASINRDPASGEGLDIYAVTRDEIKKILAQEIVLEYRDRK